MSNERPSDGQPESFERYDLTGHRVQHWTTNARDALISTLRRVLSLGSRAATAQLPGASSTISEKVLNAPGKGIEFLEARLDQTPIENQLKLAQTETEYLKQELLRHQIQQTRAEIRGRHLDNASREIEIRVRIEELTHGKSGVHFLESADGPIVVFGNLSQQSSAEIDGESAESESRPTYDQENEPEVS